jgi:hypothetical protein
MEDCRLRVFENRVLRGIFGPRRDEVTGSGENYIMRSVMICTAHQIPKHVVHMGESRIIYGVLMEKRKRKIPLGRPRHRWEDNIKLYLWDVGAWAGLSWLRIRDRCQQLVHMLMKIRFP